MESKLRRSLAVIALLLVVFSPALVGAQVFVTSETFDGDLDGFGGADSICTAAASAAGLSGTWTAWLSAGLTDARDRIADTEIRLLDGTLIATDLADLTDGSLDAPINLDENLETVIDDVNVWTATGADGTFDDRGTCNGWTSNDMALFGGTGSADRNDEGWTDIGGGNPCESLNRLYCFFSGDDQDGEHYLISAASQAAGAEGSFWQTDVDVNNTGNDVVDFTFAWYPRGADNSDPMLSESFDLEPGGSVRFENVLASAFGLPEGSNGAIGVIAPSDVLIVNSRTFNLPQVKVTGTFGQAIAGFPGNDLIDRGETWRITFMSESADFRSNLGCANAVDRNIEISLDLYSDDGSFLETITMSLPPLSNKQENRVFGPYSPVDGYVDVRSESEDALYTCYGSVLDNGSSDPTTIYPRRLN